MTTPPTTSKRGRARGKKVAEAIAAEKVLVEQKALDHRDETIRHLTEQLNAMKPLAEKQRALEAEQQRKMEERKTRRREQARAYRARKKAEQQK